MTSCTAVATTPIILIDSFSVNQKVGDREMTRYSLVEAVRDDAAEFAHFLGGDAHDGGSPTAASEECLVVWLAADGANEVCRQASAGSLCEVGEVCFQFLLACRHGDACMGVEKTMKIHVVSL